MTNGDDEGRWLDGASTPNWTYVRPEGRGEGRKHRAEAEAEKGEKKKK